MPNVEIYKSVVAIFISEIIYLYYPIIIYTDYEQFKQFRLLAIYDYSGAYQVK